MDNRKELDIVVFPWLAFGHMIPFLELSKHLATKGHRISYVSAPRNLERLIPKIPQNLVPHIKLVPFPLPRVEKLPQNAEATSDVPFDDVELLKKAYDGLNEPMAKFLEAASPIDWIIYDFPSYWLPPIADRLGVRKVFLSLMNGWSSAAFGPSSNMVKDGAGTWSNPESLTIHSSGFHSATELSTGSTKQRRASVLHTQMLLVYQICSVVDLRCVTVMYLPYVAVGSLKMNTCNF